MTDRAEIERLLQMTGRTMGGLPSQVKVLCQDDFVSKRNELCVMMVRAGFTFFDTYVIHQSDVIELLVGALRDAIRQMPCWICTKSKLPPRGLNVLTKDGHGQVRMMAFWSKDGDKWMWIENRKFTHRNDIVRWTYVPE